MGYVIATSAAHIEMWGRGAVPALANRKMEMKNIIVLLMVATFIAAHAGWPSFERYKSIIERKPFGPEPANFDPEAVPCSKAADSGAGGEMTPEQRTLEEQQLAARVRVSALNVSPSGDVKVGFTDSSAKPLESYYLKVGSSQNGWKVKAADPAAACVTLEKDGLAVTVKLGEMAGGDGVAKGAAQNGVNRHATLRRARM